MQFICPSLFMKCQISFFRSTFFLFPNIPCLVFFQENEKLYFQLKTLQATSKANEEAMFEANQKLQNQLALTRLAHCL